MKIFPVRLKFDPVIYFLALFNIFIHLLFINNLEYHRDELLYFSLGQHPAFGYETVPPMIGWIAWLMKNIFGYSLFAVRLFPAIISGVMVILVSSTAREMGGNRYAQIIAALGMIIPVFVLRTYSLYMPVHLDVFFWTLAIYLIIRYINSDSDKYLILFGIVAGLSLLNKYLIALLFMVILLIIPFTQHKRVFRKKMFWTGILAGILVFLPNIIWQIINGMPVFGHMSELARTQLVNVNLSAFLFEQLTIPGAASFLTIAGLSFLLIDKEMVRFRFLAYATLLVIVSLMMMHGKSYYTIGIYPFLIGAGSVSFGRLLKKWYSRALLPLILIFLTLLILPFGLPVYRTDGLKKYFDFIETKYGIDIGRNFEDGSKHSLPQDYADMLGWEELTAIASKGYQMIGDKSASFIYAENYGQAGAITVIGKRYKLPDAVSFNESFKYWCPKQFNPDITSLIYINDELGEDVNRLFRKITVIGKISDPDAREFGTTVYLCQDPVTSFNQFWAERLRHLNE
jgi:hypothetical protein